MLKAVKLVVRHWTVSDTDVDLAGTEHGMYAAAWICDHLAVGPVSLIQPWRRPCSCCRSCCPEPVCLMVLHLCESTKENEQERKGQKKARRSSCCVF